MVNYEILFYTKENGECPLSEFLTGLQPKMRAKILRSIEILPNFIAAHDTKHTKHLDDGIYELRVAFSSNAARVLYFFFVDNKIILTDGFMKKMQKTPTGEIAKAKKYRADTIKRLGK